MTTSATKFNVSATLVLAALAIAPQFSTSAQASVTSDLLNCRYNSRQKTVSCCEYILKNKQKPQWMQSGSRSCSAAVQCVGGEQKYVARIANITPRCYVAIPSYENQRSSTPRDQAPRQNRTLN